MDLISAGLKPSRNFIYVIVYIFIGILYVTIDLSNLCAMSNFRINLRAGLHYMFQIIIYKNSYCLHPKSIPFLFMFI